MSTNGKSGQRNDTASGRRSIRVVQGRRPPTAPPGDGDRPVDLPGLDGFRAAAYYLLAGLVPVVITAIFGGVHLAASVNENIWWFQSIGLGDVYGRIWSTERNLYLVAGCTSYLFFTLIFFGTRALTYRPGPDRAARSLNSTLVLVAGFLVAVVALIVAHAFAGEWQQYLLASHSQSFGITDPVHHRDTGFYVFTLPWRETLSTFVFVLVVLGALELGGLAALYTLSSPFQTAQEDRRRLVAIGSLFAAIVFAYLAWRNFYLNPFYLNQSGTVYGGGATFIHATLWWIPIVGRVELLTAAVLLVNVFLRRVGLTWIALLPIVVGISSSAGQGIFQHFVVSPNELSAEFTYLGYTLHNTRHAYGIDGWQVREYTPHVLTAADIGRNAATVADARIADSGAVTQVIQQRQENRTYYSFNTADLDRYPIDGRSRQVLLAARELSFGNLQLQARTWVNEHIKYTHGYGLTMAPANTVTSDGQPVLWIQNVPVQETQPGLPAVRQPRIYFGENTASWILTGATTPEFDSSSADRDTSYYYKGPDGVALGSGLRRLTLSWLEEGGFPFFNRLNISSYIRPTTRILLHREIFDRVQTIAPWLTIDSDPYLVLRTNGSLAWMMDGLTSTSWYPYSDPTDGANYQRNSVKIVLDAYTGRPTFYAFDAADPILRAWSAAFPGLIHPLSTMPSDLRAHIKYPDDYLDWQAAGYQRYHVTDITSYYNGDNEWDIESSTAYNWNDDAIETSTLQPIWTVARLFGEPRDSFFSLLPFSVRGKAPMAGYLAADNNTYRVTALDMPRGAQTTGVTQFQSLFNQAPAISSTLTLLDQHGSQVVPGQMLILPVGKALLYIEPLYLRSASAQSLPQLVKVVVGTQNEVNWGSTLPVAINNLLTQGDISNVSPAANQPGNAPSPTPVPTALPATGKYAKLSDQQLISLANQYYQAAQATPSLTEKDRDLRQLGQILAVLRGRHVR
jgi:uncharacterized membrane protein (UPF0182 family)